MGFQVYIQSAPGVAVWPAGCCYCEAFLSLQAVSGTVAARNTEYRYHTTDWEDESKPTQAPNTHRLSNCRPNLISGLAAAKRRPNTSEIISTIHMHQCRTKCKKGNQAGHIFDPNLNEAGLHLILRVTHFYCLLIDAVHTYTIAHEMHDRSHKGAMIIFPPHS